MGAFDFTDVGSVRERIRMTTFRSGRKPHAVGRLGVELLEKRELMAGDVSAYVTGQMLIIWGDAADNGVTLTSDSATQKYQISGRDAGGSPTTINGLDTTQPANVVEFSGVKQVFVGLNGGNDDFEVGSTVAVDTVIQKWMTIEMGDGDDQVTLGVAGNDAGGGAPIARSLQVGTSLNVDLGAGNDHLSLANADIGLSLNVLAGDGDDNVDFDTEFTPTGSTTPTLFPVQVHGNTLISLGGGLDELTVKNASFQRSLVILDGAGAAQISIANVNASKKIDIFTGNDADEINLQVVRAKQLNMTTNGGIDHVVLNNITLTTLNVKLGSARDHLRVDHTRTSLAAHLDGGGQNSTLAGSANALHGLWRQNFG
jgi:hypothetical protein